MPRTMLGCVLAGVAAAAMADPPDLSTLEVPEGFRIELFADDVPNARAMVLGEEGTLFVGSRDRGRLYAVRHDGTRATRVTEIDRGLTLPSGVAFRDGALYVAALNRILRYDAIESKLDDPPEPVVVYDGFPTDRHHGWKFIAFGPDGWLYVPVGAPCNICDPDAPFASIQRMKPDGSVVEPWARGVRNSVGFDWNPADGSLWFTDNGRDWMGDDQPPCELNRAPEPGMHFGYPYCHGVDVSDPEFGEGHDCADYVAPEVEFAAHTAPLGMRFYTGDMFPAAWRGDVFVAQHGSWNRSSKIGYRVMHVPIDGAKAGEATPFVSGWLRGESVSGRPVDVLVMPDGALLISDDLAGVIYRVSYGS